MAITDFKFLRKIDRYNENFHVAYVKVPTERFAIMRLGGAVSKWISTNCETNLTSTSSLHKEQLSTQCSITLAKVSEKIDVIITSRIETIIKSITEKLTS